MWLQILGELLYKGLSVFRLLLPRLFGSNDTASDLTVGDGHERVHVSSGSASGSLKQRDDIFINFAVFGW
jgi:hypothetical protein